MKIREDNVCDICGKIRVIVEIVDNFNYEYNIIWICKNCLFKALKLLTERKIKS